MAEFLYSIAYNFPDVRHLQGVNWAQSWTKRANFEYLPFQEKIEFFKDSSNNFYIL